MGVLSKRDTKKQAAPQIMRWDTQSDAPDWLDARRAVCLGGVGMLAVAAKHTDYKFTQVQFLDEGFALGAGPAGGEETCTFKPKWRLLVVLADKGVALVDLMAFTTQDDGLVDKKAIVRARDWLRGTLETGISVGVAEGLPDFADWVTPIYLPSMLGISTSVFDGDLLPEIPRCFGHGARLGFPGASAGVLSKAFEACGGSRTSAEGVLAVLETSFWSDRHGSRLVLAAGDGEARIEVSCPQFAELSLVGRHRLFRSTLRGLEDLSHALDAAPADKAVIDGYRAACAGPSEAPDRAPTLVPIWTTKISAATVPLREGMRFPVGVAVSSTRPLEFDQVLDAERALLVRQRTWGEGFTRKTRAANPQYRYRRPAVLASADGAVEPCLRYVHTDQSGTDSLSLTDDDATWFWQTQFVPLQADEQGRHRAVLLVDGLSVADGIVAYGTELFTLFRAWVGTVLAGDPAARIETLYVQLPGGSTGPASGDPAGASAVRPAAPASVTRAAPPATPSVELGGDIPAPGDSGAVPRDSQSACPACSAALLPSARFCGSCGAKVPAPFVCVGCGAESRSAARFCGACGRPMADGNSAAGGE